MATITWSETDPANTALLSLGDDAIRSLKTSVRIALDDEHVFPSAGGDAGVHRRGSAKAYYGTQSIVSSAGTDGKLMVTSDTSNLFHVGSAGTMFLGGQRVLSAASAPTGGQRYGWATDFGNVLTKSGLTSVTFANSGFSGIPFTTITAIPVTEQPNVGVAFGVVLNQSSAGFNIASYLTSGGLSTSDTSYMWISIGTRVF